MIEFSCSSCSKKYSVPPEYAGKKARCKECNKTNVVPVKYVGSVLETISLSCGKCSYKMAVKAKYAGKKLKCPKCGAMCEVPVDGKQPEPNSVSNISFCCITCGEELSAKASMRGKAIECTGCGSLAEVPYGDDNVGDWDYDPGIDESFLNNLVALGVDAKNAEEIEIERPRKKVRAGQSRGSEGGFMKKLFGK